MDQHKVEFIQAWPTFKMVEDWAIIRGLLKGMRLSLYRLQIC